MPDLGFRQPRNEGTGFSHVVFIPGFLLHRSSITTPETFVNKWVITTGEMIVHHFPAAKASPS